MALNVPFEAPEYSAAGPQQTRSNSLPLAPELYSLSEEESRFFKALTGITDDEALKRHILKVQAEAYRVYPYPCIRQFSFSKLKISRHPAYQLLLEKAQDPSAIFLDVGCCFGNDARKVAFDGFPAERILASDLRQEFWDLGYRLFKDNPTKCEIHFVAGNVLEDSFLDTQMHSNSEADTLPSFTSLNEVKTLTQVQGRLACIHAASLFHLFDEPTQLDLARRLATLLSPAPGSFIFGSHGGLPEKGYRGATSGLRPMFCHSVISWTELWDGVVFEKGTVQVEASIREMHREHLDGLLEPGMSLYNLIWKVTRL